MFCNLNFQLSCIVLIASLLDYQTVSREKLLEDGSRVNGNWKFTLDIQKYWELDMNILLEVKIDNWNKTRILISHRNWNRRQKAMNGNRNNCLKVVQWNMGAKLWKNKLDEIELALSEHKPDLCFISEANLWAGAEPHEMEIQGHNIIMPNTMETLLHARIILLVREGIEVEKLDNLMDDQVATIWVRVGQNRRQSINIGGIYREHKQLGTTDKDLTSMELIRVQEKRWVRIIKKNGRKPAVENV